MQCNHVPIGREPHGASLSPQAHPGRVALLGGGLWKATRWHLLVLSSLLPAYLLITAFGPRPSSDEGSYLVVAEQLVHGSSAGGVSVVSQAAVALDARIDIWFGPGLPLLIAPLVAFGAPVELLRLVAPLLLFGAVVLFWMVLRITVPGRVALAGALALGLYLPFLPLLPTLHSEIPAVLWVVGFTAGFTHYVRRGEKRWLALAAGSLAALALTRVVFGWVLALFLVVVLIVLVFHRAPHVKQAALVSAIGLLLTVPWLVYTYSLSGRPFYWGSAGGESLYWMASPYPGEYGDWHPSHDAREDPRLAAHRPFFRSLRGLDEVEFDKRVTSKAVDLILHHPSAYARHVVANVSRLWFSTPFSHTEQKLSTMFYALPNSFLLAGLVFSAAVLARVRRLPPETFVFASLLIIGVGFQSLLSAYTRMLAPLLPLMVWFIAQAVARIAVVQARNTSV